MKKLSMGWHFFGVKSSVDAKYLKPWVFEATAFAVAFVGGVLLFNEIEMPNTADAQYAAGEVVDRFRIGSLPTYIGDSLRD